MASGKTVRMDILLIVWWTISKSFGRSKTGPWRNSKFDVGSVGMANSTLHLRRLDVSSIVLVFAKFENGVTEMSKLELQAIIILHSPQMKGG